MNDNAVHTTHFRADRRRDILWQALWDYHFRHRIAPDACVLDLGSGYGSFINHVEARRRIALDQWPGFTAHLALGVEAIVGPATDLSGIAAGSVDFAFASNLFEHLSQQELASVLGQLCRLLAPGGKLCLLQPNWRYAYRHYFDDYTHVTVWSHDGMVDFLTANGWEVSEVRPRFLPLTLKSSLPVSSLLIRAYLLFPWKIMGGQMMITAQPKP